MKTTIRLYNAKNEEKGEISAEGQKLFIYGDIVGSQWDKWAKDDTCPQDVAELFKSFDKAQPVDVYINSGGGDVFGALAICSVIGRHLGETRAHIDGIAASAASVIACACDTVDMPAYAQMMIHKPWTGVRGNVDDLLRACDMLDAAEESIIAVYRGKLADGKT
ncbi:MAG: Clp protease ClpP, partial [Ruminococcus sp.]|nr:Clp protease ClpP [Ruminococcus sp.]